MSQHNNVIDNVNVVLTNNYNDNVNDRYKNSRTVEATADQLIHRLGMKAESRPFMCKAIYRLSEASLWDNCEQALKGKNPAGLFIWLCKRDGV